MKIMPIFVDDVTLEGLHSICYIDGEESEYDRIMNLWNNPVYIRRYCIENLEYLQSGFYGDISLEDAINGIRQEIEKIQDLLYNSTKKGYRRSGETLQKIFQPLNNKEDRITDLQKNKIKLKTRGFEKSKVRVYAIRVSENTFIITGGAIKFVRDMKDQAATDSEEKKIKRVRDWLKDNQISTVDDLIYYYEEQ